MTPVPANSSRAGLRSAADCLPRRAWHGRKGFTLVDVGLALLCLGLAVYIAVSEIHRFRHRAQRDVLAKDLQDFAAAFENYRKQQGDWPPATNGEKVIPRGMEASLASSRWLAGSPFGGNFEWIPPARAGAGSEASGPMRAQAALIALSAYSPHRPLDLSPADLQYIDARIDDGDLKTGHFRTGFNGWPVYHVQAGTPAESR